MPDDGGTDWKAWAEKAARRLAECEADIAALDSPSDSRRRQKLELRAGRYRELADRLSARSSRGGPDGEDVERLKERIWNAAAALARDRARLLELRRLAAGNGHPAGSDLALSPPPADAPEALRRAHEVLRSLGL